jgi:ABC-type multidrug transport system fused ATPase/permease subunit
MIEANSGLQYSLFFLEATFHRLFVEFVEKMRAPAVEAAENVHHTMLELHQKVHLNKLERFPRSKHLPTQSVTEIAREIVEECLVLVIISIVIIVIVTILFLIISTISIVIIVIVTILFLIISTISIVTNLRPPDRLVDRFDFNSADPRLGRRRRS